MSLRTRIALATHGHRCPPDTLTISPGVVFTQGLEVEFVEPVIEAELVDDAITVEIVNTDLELCNV